MVRVPCSIACAVLVAGCSLDEGGTSANAGDAGDLDVASGADGAVDDAPFSSDVLAVDVLGDAPPADAGPCTTPTSACGGLPAGWNPVAFVENPTSTCPSGWTTRTGLDKPAAGPTACSCSCTGANPTCDGADLGTNIAPAFLCALGAKTLPMASSACKSIGSTTLDNYIKVPPIAPSGGGCAVVLKANAADVTATPVRECDPVPACKGDLCAGIAPSTYLACVEKAGDQATCPNGFPNRYLVGDAVNPQCGNGTCACGAKASCGAPSLLLYSDTTCATKVLETPADDKCNATNANGTKFQSYRYLSTPSVQCTGSGAASATPVVVTTLRTACCP